MAQFQLSISSDYVADWGVFEGVRELIQNALDAQQDGHPMQIACHNGKLKISSEGVRLLRSVWLMGTTSKAGGDYRGHFGEGLKLGVLALVRAGRKVTIVNDDETWSVSLSPSVAFGDANVLTVATRKRPRRTGSFSIELECLPSEWAQYRQAFLAITPPQRQIETNNTDILLDERQRGRCYVKGILVQVKGDLRAGYNFRSASTDRDRRMIDSFDFEYYTAHAWLDATRSGGVTPEQLLDHIETPAPDSDGVGRRVIGSDLEESVGQVFRARHGCAAIPVRNHSEANEAAHLGKVGIVSTPAVCAFFADATEFSLERIRRECRAEVEEVYDFDQLSSNEQDNLGTALELVESAARGLKFDPLQPRLSVVRFRSDQILGLHSRVDGPSSLQAIRIARTVLASLQKTVQVLVHELAHDAGADGTVDHERAEGELFSRIICDLALARPAADPLRALQAA
jgi:hypothetical protein